MISKLARQIPSSISLSISAKVKKMKSEGMDVISFGAGEPDFDTVSAGKKWAVDAIHKGYTKYTSTAGIIDLRMEAAKWISLITGHAFRDDEVMVSAGAKQCLLNILLTILNPGDEVLIPLPYWLSYPEMVKIARGIPRYVPSTEDNHFKITG